MENYSEPRFVKEMEDGGEQRLPGEREPPVWRWFCRICGTDCEDVDGFRVHCMSQSHYDGLQLYGLHPELFPPLRRCRGHLAGS